jgi:hypothetical protein
MTFCIKCGQPLGDDVTFCPRCGYQIDGSSPELPPARIALAPRPSEYSLSAPPAGWQNPAWSAPEPVRRNSSRWLWILAGGAVLVGIIQQSNHSTPAASSVPDSVYQSAARIVAAEPARPPEAPTPAPYQIPAPPSPPAVDVSEIRAVMAADREFAAPMTEFLDHGATDSGSADEHIDAFARRIRDYVGKARDNSVASCPRDFAEAYVRLVSAHSEVADAMESHPHLRTQDEEFLEGFLRGLKGDPTGGAIEMEDERRSWLAKVKDTLDAASKRQNDLDALLVRYGAK